MTTVSAQESVVVEGVTLKDSTTYVLELYGVIPDPTDWEALAKDWGFDAIQDSCKQAVNVQAYTFGVWQQSMYAECKGFIETEFLKLDLCRTSLASTDSLYREVLFERQDLRRKIVELERQLAEARAALNPPPE